MIENKYECKICGSSDITSVDVRDWIAKGENVYTYDECGKCGTLAIRNLNDIPGPDHYNMTYGSFTESELVGGAIKRRLRAFRNRYVLLKFDSILACIFNYIKPLPFEFSALSRYANSKSKILDVGCGSGKYLRELRAAGYTNVSGIDPFLGKDEDVVSNIPIRKKKIEEIFEKFDIIISHHSLEHSEDPLSMLNAFRRNLSPDGYAIITVPVLGKLYQRYRQYTYIIQAPQHAFLFTVDGVIFAAKFAGLELVEMRRGTEFEREWINISNLWRSKSGHKINEPIDKKSLAMVGPGDNVTYVFKQMSHCVEN